MHANLGRRVAGRAVLAAAAASGACSLEPPDAGTLGAVYARPAERVEVHRLGFNQTLGELFWRSDVDGNEQASLLLAFSQHASPRRIRENTEITFRYLTDTGSLRSVDVAINADETVRVMRYPAGWAAEKIQTPVFVDTLIVSGEIDEGNNNLWWAVGRNEALGGMPYADVAEIVHRLDGVFQWQMDFSRQVRLGDTFRFAFERVVRPDGSMRTGRLLATEYVNAGTAFHAVWFDPNGDGQGSYYDLEGESVRRSFLLKPLDFRRISSRFSNSRRHPILGIWRAHRGVDYAADTGTEVKATADGVVVHRGRDGGYGNSVEIRHPNGWLTRYAHLNGFRRGIVVGSRVRQGDVIGYVGQTGLARGSHLHYEMIQGGRYKDPLEVELPPGDPVPGAVRVRWLDEMSARMALLESVPGSGPPRVVSAEAQSAQQPEGSGG